MEILDASEVIESFGLPYFRELSTLGALSDEVILYLLHKGTIKQFEKGEYLDREGDIAEEFQVVLFDRSKRSPELNQFGQALVLKARDIIHA